MAKLLEGGEAVPELRPVVRASLAAPVKAHHERVPPEMRFVRDGQEHAARQAGHGLFEPRVLRRHADLHCRGRIHAAEYQTVRTVPPSMTSSAPWIDAARSEAT